MKYYLLDREEIKQNNSIVVWGESRVKPTPLPNQFIFETEDGTNIPNNWLYDETLDTLIDLGNIPRDQIQDKENFLREKHKEIRDKKVSENIAYNGEYYQVRAKDIANFEDAYSLLQDNQTIEWITADNKLAILSKEDINNILTQYKLRKNEIYKTYIDTFIKK